jgi:hypothetical protein
MSEFSPAARSVFDAYISHWTADPYEISPEALAAALRSAADQVAPEPDDIDKGSLSLAAIRNRCKVRDELLAIAAELEGRDG